MKTSETIKLDFPIKSKEGVTLEEIVIRRPKVKDIQAAQVSSNDMQNNIRLIANLAMLHPDDIGELDAFDFKKVETVFESFSGQSGTTA